MAEELLRAEHISKRFGGVIALDDVSLSIRRGEICCLVGENGSGKSTMIKIISGVYTPDEGDLYINGHHYKRLTPIEAIHEGIQVIYQDFSLFPNLTVAENIAINEQLASGKQLVHWKEIHRIAREGLAKINVSLPLDAVVETLPTADRQLIAIIKALLANARLIIMDEPTTALTQREIQALFGVIRELKERGLAILFVSHKLNEVVEIADRTIIFRNGKKVLDQDAKGLDIQTMAFYMTGRRLDAGSAPLGQISETISPLLRVENLSLPHGFFDVSFELRPGEVLGITGLLGSGRTELALSLFGVLPANSGKVFIEGKEVKIRSIADAVRHGIGYVPEDRIREGLFLDQPIGDNVVITLVDRLVTRLRLLNGKAKAREADRWIQQLEVKTPSRELPAKSLSGGNQQRVVLAKWIARNPKILILNGPTVGVDVGSKAEIHELIHNLARRGMGILLISDDIPELIQCCHRVLLMRAGRIVREFKREELTEQALNVELIASAMANPR
ncbi:MAG: sugar ABC transporter ATP-binding protein [Anaerolineae bacterium]|nr:sugar ABC transporter ATP-binding protein [Anaerolineae bacterium]MDW8100717.1 sugar ABC transporter ATP-binding protein [Anaerolineae bacterium]